MFLPCGVGMCLHVGVVSVAFSSCLQKDVYDPANSGDKEEEVTLDNYFDFATTKNIQLNIDYGKGMS